MKSYRNKIHLRIASIHDRPILDLWDRQQHVIDCDPNDEWDWSYELTRSPNWRDQLIAEINGRPIGFLQIIDPVLEETHYWGSIEHGTRAIDIWIGLKKDLGKGYGSQIMKLALERIFKDKDVHRVVVDPLVSNLEAISFYKKLGFIFLENKRFGHDNCSVYLYKREWFELS